MPYKIEERSGQYCVIKADDGSTVKCHATKAEADAHLGALYANVEDAKMTQSIPARLLITKTADGRYRWTSISSNNALDRDGEIVSSMALEMDVYRSKQYGDESELRLFHLPYAVGGAPDFRAVVDGHLVETGEFFKSGTADAIAEWMIRNPDAPDGSGWGTSIGFRGYTDINGIYHQIEITERSVLPLSSAANPYTSFSTLKEANMPISKRQSDFLEQMLTDPEVRGAAQAILEASNQSKALDLAGVQRKEAITSVQDTQYAGGPGGIFNQPGTNGKAEGDKPAEDPKCADCGHAKSDHGADGCNVSGCDCTGFAAKAKAVRENPTSSIESEKGNYSNALTSEQIIVLAELRNNPANASGSYAYRDTIEQVLIPLGMAEGGSGNYRITSFGQMVLNDASKSTKERRPRTKKAAQTVAAQPVDKSILNLTLDGLAEVIDSYVQKSLTKYTNESPDMVKLVEVIQAQSTAISEMRKTLADQVQAEERIKARYETPRILSDLLASRSNQNLVDEKTDPLVKQANAALEDDQSIFAKLGLGKGN